MTRIVSIVPLLALSACIDSGPPTHELDASWSAAAHSTRVSEDRVSVAVFIGDGDRTLDWQRVDGYDGQYRFAFATDAPSVRLCATLEYSETVVNDPPPWCGSDCDPQEEVQHWPLGDMACTDVTLDADAPRATLALTVWN